MIYLSHTITPDTPTYGNRNKVKLNKKSSIANGDVANDSFLETTVHVGTHIDFPYHFYENGQTIEDYDADFWFFNKPLFVEIEPKSEVVFTELIEVLEQCQQKDCDILIVKTGICHQRHDSIFWEKNYGFDPKLYEYLVAKYPGLRIFGFDSISVSSILHRDIGREAHRRFLDPSRPVLLLEDMDLTSISSGVHIKSIIVSPLRIENCDGSPCTVFAELA
ncbi:MAG: cyclase family protein [Campylobacterales bacterium]|nr:cyclase family protein [Campylobacterales bacterium]